MSYTQLISQPSGNWWMQLHPAYLYIGIQLAGKNNTTARAICMLLSVFEVETIGKLKAREQAQYENRLLETDLPTDLWFWKTKSRLKEQLMGFVGDTAIDRALELLLEAKLIDRKTYQPNPTVGVSYKYALDANAVQNTVDNAPRKFTAPTLKFKDTPPDPTLKFKDKNKPKAKEKKKRKTPATRKPKKPDFMWNAITHAFQMKSTSRIGKLKKFFEGRCGEGEGQYWGHQGIFVAERATFTELFAFGIWIKLNERKQPERPKTIATTFETFRSDGSATGYNRCCESACISVEAGALLKPYASIGTETSPKSQGELPPEGDIDDTPLTADQLAEGKAQYENLMRKMGVDTDE